MFPAIQFLNPGMVNDHSEKTPRCKQRIYLAEAVFGNAAVNELRQYLVALGHILAKEPVREPMVLQRAVEQKTGKRLVAGAALQNLRRHRGEDFQVTASRLKLFAHALGGSGLRDLALDHRPVEFFLAGEMAEDQGLGDPGLFGDLAGSGAVE